MHDERMPFQAFPSMGFCTYRTSRAMPEYPFCFWPPVAGWRQRTRAALCLPYPEACEMRATGINRNFCRWHVNSQCSKQHSKFEQARMIAAWKIASARFRNTSLACPCCSRDPPRSRPWWPYYSVRIIIVRGSPSVVHLCLVRQPKRMVVQR